RRSRPPTRVFYHRRRAPQRHTLFPYTTLFRSVGEDPGPTDVERPPLAQHPGPGVLEPVRVEEELGTRAAQVEPPLRHRHPAAARPAARPSEHPSREKLPRRRLLAAALRERPRR